MFSAVHTMKPCYCNNLEKGASENSLCLLILLSVCVGHNFFIFVQVNSPITGTIKVEDVVLEFGNGEGSDVSPSKLKFFRRLVFERNPNLIQSDASLVPVIEDTQRKGQGKGKKKGKGKDISQISKRGTYRHAPFYV